MRNQMDPESRVHDLSDVGLVEQAYKSEREVTLEQGFARAPVVVTLTSQPRPDVGAKFRPGSSPGLRPPSGRRAQIHKWQETAYS